MTTALLSPTLLPTALVRHDSPLGRLEIHTQFGAVTRLDIERNGELPYDHLVETASPLHDEVRRQLDDYFAGRRSLFELPVSQVGTPFQNEVWQVLEDVPWGVPTSYGDLALATGRPTGARAVGGAVRANRIAVIVPCHRVLSSSGHVTGYTPGEGIATKIWLLRHEGIDFVP